eukprot:1281221-Lingulodinium_polyedra.AAC.1
MSRPSSCRCGPGRRPRVGCGAGMAPWGRVPRPRAPVARCRTGRVLDRAAPSAREGRRARSLRATGLSLARL